MTTKRHWGEEDDTIVKHQKPDPGRSVFSPDIADQAVYNTFFSLPYFTFLDYYRQLFFNVHCELLHHVCATIYINRVLEKNDNIVFTKSVCHRLYLAALLVAFKYNTDGSSYVNRMFAQYGDIRLAELNMIEINFLQLVDFDLNISLDVYQKYLDKTANSNAVLVIDAKFETLDSCDNDAEVEWTFLGE